MVFKQFSRKVAACFLADVQRVAVGRKNVPAAKHRWLDVAEVLNDALAQS